MRILLFFGAAAFGLTACGGDVVVETGTGGTSTTTTETTTSTATTTSTTTTVTTTTATTTTTTTTVPACEMLFPGILSPCSVEAQVCPVNFACCGGHAVCKG